MSEEEGAPAVVVGQFTDIKSVKSLKVTRLTVEIPIELTKPVIDTLGYPVNEGINVAVVVLNKEGNFHLGVNHSSPLLIDQSPEQKPEPQEKKEAFNSASECAILCTKELFWRFLESYAHSHHHESFEVQNKEDADRLVKSILGIDSKKVINMNKEVKINWNKLRAEYQAWQMMP